jgi:ATP-dependent Lon protease
MTGEVTLRGRVLPVGGIKEKVIAAHRAGLATVVLPADNDADLDDVPEAVRKELDIRLVSHMDEVLTIAFAGAPAAKQLRPAS